MTPILRVQTAGPIVMLCLIDYWQSSNGVDSCQRMPGIVGALCGQRGADRGGGGTDSGGKKRGGVGQRA